MRTGRHRHPVLEAAVFAAALLLSAFVARELWRRRPVPRPATGSEIVPPIVLSPSHPALTREEERRRTETGVNSVAPIKLSRVQPPKHRDAVPPVPK